MTTKSSRPNRRLLTWIIDGQREPRQTDLNNGLSDCNNGLSDCPADVTGGTLAIGAEQEGIHGGFKASAAR